MSEPVGIVGLGRVGLAAAKAYLASGFKVYGFDINSRACEDFRAAGGTFVDSPGQVAKLASVVLILVLNDEQAIEVMKGKSGIMHAATGKLTIVFMSTVNQRTVHDLANECLNRSVGFVDCPFTGGPARVPNRSLTIIASGPFELVNAMRPFLKVIGNIVYAGAEPGVAQAIKHCNQLLVGVTHAATMELIALARKLGLDPTLVASVAGSGIAGSDYFRLLSESVLKKIPSPGGLGQMCKDMSILKNTLGEQHLNARVALAASTYFHTALEHGMADREGADLIEVVEGAGGK